MTETKIHIVKFQHRTVPIARLDLRFVDSDIRDECIKILREKEFDCTDILEFEPFTRDHIQDIGGMADEVLEEARFWNEGSEL